MAADFVGKDILIIQCLDSTNDYCKELTLKQTLPEGTVVWAQKQLKGRGHGNSSWESAEGENLTFSIIFHPVFLDPSDQFLLSMIISLGITDFLNEITKNVYIKWPNDIYIDSKKIAGILIENSITDSLISCSIAGIGININQTSFNNNIPNPVSVKQIIGANMDLKKCLSNICRKIDYWYSRLKQDERTLITNCYTQLLYGLNQRKLYRTDNIEINGCIRGIDNFGRLAIETDNGLIRYFGLKEVEFLH